VLIVDAANVVGSRPDGWWRDRPAAARRLYDHLLATGLDGVVLVLEGQARQGVGLTDGDDAAARHVRVVHAAGTGDDAIVDLVRQGASTVTVVSADRELRRRVLELGADVVGPRYVWEGPRG